MKHIAVLGPSQEAKRFAECVQRALYILCVHTHVVLVKADDEKVDGRLILPGAMHILQFVGKPGSHVVVTDMGTIKNVELLLVQLGVEATWRRWPMSPKSTGFLPHFLHES